MLRVEGLSKRYGTVWAARDVSFHVDRGEIFGLLGPNGAGKSTIIKSILGLVRPSQGSVALDGIDALTHPAAARVRMGYFPQKLALYPNLTVEETLHFFALARGLHPDTVDSAIEALGLPEIRHRRVGQLSGGMQQRVGLAQTFLGDPDLLILDEPTASLDPMVAGELKLHLRQLREAGKAVLLASHVLAEVQDLADRVAIMLRGRIIALGTIADLSRSLQLTSRIHLVLARPSPEALALAHSFGATKAELTDHSLVAEVDPGHKLTFLTAMASSGVEILDFHTQEPSLEEVFLRYVARSS